MTHARRRRKEGQLEHRACKIETLAELADCLVGVVPHSITDIANNIQRYYKRRSRKKRDGSSRTLRVPVDTLKTLQRKIAGHILSRVEVPKFVYGGVRGRSMRQMVEKHSG